MSAPTPAPLSDEQIEAIITGWRGGNRHLCHMQSEGLMDPEESDAAFDAQLAAVTAKAKREERERVGRELIEAIREERDGDDWSWDTALMKAEVKVEVICGLEATDA